MKSSAKRSHRRLGLLGMGWVLAGLLGVGCGTSVDSQEQRETNKASDLQRYGTHARKADQALTLAAARELALHNSLQRVMEMQEAAIRKEMATKAWRKLLPSFTADFDRSIRSQNAASNSIDGETGEISLATNYSSDRHSRTYGVTAMWNLLDFGITYWQARQSEERVRISARKYQRIRQNLALDVTRAYWRLVVARKAASGARELIQKVEAQEQRIEASLKAGSVERSSALRDQKRLIQTAQRLKRFLREDEAARGDLARLMGLRPGEAFEIAQPEIPDMTDFMRFDAAQLQDLALRSRPELFQQDAEEEISRHNVRVAMLRLLPSPSLVLKHNWDRNPHLYANYWYTLAGKAAFQLLQLPEKIRGVKSAKMERELIQMRRMAVAVGILSQLHLSLIEYHATAERGLSTTEIAGVQGELMTVTDRMVRAGSLSRKELLFAEIERFFARMRHAQAYGRVQGLIAQIQNTVGQDPQAMNAMTLPRLDLAHQVDPDDIENLPSLAMVARRLPYSAYDIQTRAKKVLLGAGEEGAQCALEVLNSADERARVMATIIVRENGSARVVASLLPALSDNNPQVRHQAVLALRDAFGKNFGYYHNARTVDRDAAIAKWRDYLFTPLEEKPPAETPAAASDQTSQHG